MNWMYALSFWVATGAASDVSERDRDSATRTPVVAPLQVPADAPWIRHVVQRRETAEEIADRFGVDPSALHDRKRRPLDPEAVKPGRVLWIPAAQRPQPRQRRRLWVAERSTWAEVAATYSTSEHPLDADLLRTENPRFARRKTVPARQWISVWADSGVGPQPQPAALSSVEVEAEVPGISIGRPQVGRIKHAIQLEDGPGFEVLFPDAAWGTSLTIETLQIGIEGFRARSGYPGTLQVGAISRRKGGMFPPHRSHQSGRDVDIRLPAMPFAQGKMHLRPDEVDWHAAWVLLQTFVDTGEVQAVFVDQRHQRRLMQAGIRMGASDDELESILGRVTHAPGHRGHLHLRIRCTDGNARCKG